MRAALSTNPQRLANTLITTQGPGRFTMLRLVGGSIPDGGPAAEDLVSVKGRVILKTARESCVDEMRATEQQQGVNLENLS